MVGRGSAAAAAELASFGCRTPYDGKNTANGCSKAEKHSKVVWYSLQVYRTCDSLADGTMSELKHDVDNVFMHNNILFILSTASTLMINFLPLVGNVRPNDLSPSKLLEIARVSD